MRTQTNTLTIAHYMRKPEILERFRALLGHDAESYVQSVLIAVAASDDLMACTPHSVMRAALRAASLGLSCDPALKQAWLIPYNRKLRGEDRWVKECQFQPHYRGLYTLAARTGKYLIINVGPIYDGQTVLENPLTGLHVVMESNGLVTNPDVTNPARALTSGYADEWRDVTLRRDRGKTVIGWMAYFETRRGIKKSVYKSIEEIEEHAKKYVRDYDKNPNWQNADKRSIMEMKTVFRELMGWADLSGSENANLAEALRIDADGEIVETVDNQETPTEPPAEEFAEKS